MESYLSSFAIYLQIFYFLRVDVTLVSSSFEFWPNLLITLVKNKFSLILTEFPQDYYKKGIYCFKKYLLGIIFYNSVKKQNIDCYLGPNSRAKFKKKQK